MRSSVAIKSHRECPAWMNDKVLLTPWPWWPRGHDLVTSGRCSAPHVLPSWGSPRSMESAVGGMECLFSYWTGVNRGARHTKLFLRRGAVLALIMLLQTGDSVLFLRKCSSTFQCFFSSLVCQLSCQLTLLRKRSRNWGSYPAKNETAQPHSSFPAT